VFFVTKKIWHILSGLSYSEAQFGIFCFYGLGNSRLSWWAV